MYVVFWFKWLCIVFIINVGWEVIIWKVFDLFSFIFMMWIILDVIKYVIVERIVFCRLNINEMKININVFKNKIRLFVLNGNFWESSMVSILMLFKVLLLWSVIFILNLRIILLIMVMSSVFFLIIVGVWCMRLVLIVNEIILRMENMVKFFLICWYFNYIKGMLIMVMRILSGKLNRFEVMMLMFVIFLFEIWFGIKIVFKL